MRRTYDALGGLLLAAALVLAGCGGGDRSGKAAKSGAPGGMARVTVGFAPVQTFAGANPKPLNAAGLVSDILYYDVSIKEGDTTWYQTLDDQGNPGYVRIPNLSNPADFTVTAALPTGVDLLFSVTASANADTILFSASTTVNLASDQTVVIIGLTVEQAGGSTPVPRITAVTATYSVAPPCSETFLCESDSADLVVTVAGNSPMTVTFLDDPAVPMTDGTNPIGFPDSPSPETVLATGGTTVVPVTWTAPASVTGTVVSPSRFPALVRVSTGTPGTPDYVASQWQLNFGVRHYTGLEAEGTPGAPVPLDAADSLPYLGQVNFVNSYYVVAGLASNSLYAVSLTGLSDDVDLYVYDNASFLSPLCISDSFIPFDTDEFCNGVTSSDTGELYIRVDGQFTFPGGGTYTVNVAAATALASEGAAGTPLFVSVPHNGQVDAADNDSYYNVTTGGGENTITLTNLTGDVDPLVYTDSTFTTVDTNWTCTDNFRTEPDSCTATIPKSVDTSVYIRVINFAGSTAGATFTLDMTALESEGAVNAPLAVTVPYNGQVNSADTASYYVVTAVGGENTISLTNLTDDVDLEVYTDATFVTLDTNWTCSLNFDTDPESCTATTPVAAGPVYIKVPNFTISGGTYTLDVLAATNVFIETVDNASTEQPNAADTVIDLYASDGTTLLATNDDSDSRGCCFSDLSVHLAPGTYYVKVTGFENDSPGRYSLRVNLTGLTGTASAGAPTDPDANEPNDTAGTATTISLPGLSDNTLTTADADWFVFVVP